MKIISLLVAPLLCCTIATNALAAELKKPGPSPSDALFDPSRVIQIEIRLDPDDWHALRISHRDRGSEQDFSEFAEKPYEYYRAEVVIDGRKVQSVGVRKKGFIGSAISTRPSLKIKFDEYVKDQEFGGLDMMTLNNNNQDPTQAQQFMVYSIMNQVGIMAPRCNLARVTVNGEHLGVYTHAESIGKPFIRRFFEKANGDLYEGYAGDFKTNAFNRIIHKWGKDDDRVELTRLLEVIQSPGPIEIARLEKLMDLDGFIKLWATEVLVGHEDSYSGNGNNWYVYRDRKTGRFHFIVWGADSDFRVHRKYAGRTVPKSVRAQGELCRRLWELPDIRSRYQAEMQRLLDSAWDEKALLAELDRILQLTEDYRTVDEKDVKELSTSIRDYVTRRREDVQAELNGPAPDWPSPRQAAVSTETPKQMIVSGTFSTVMGGPMERPGPGAKERFGTGVAQLEFTIDDETHAPFTRYNATAGMATGYRKDYPAIVIVAADASGEQMWTLSVTMDPHQIRRGRNTLEADLFSAFAILTKEAPEPQNRQERRYNVYGTIELDDYSPEPGSPVSGRFKLNTPAFISN